MAPPVGAGGKTDSPFEQALLAAYPNLRAEDLVNAWAYARAHAEDIESQIRENETA